MRFSEPVEAEFGAVRVFDSGGREVQAGRTFHPGDRSAEVAVRLRDGLGEDGYTVTYRVISADSHPVSGGFVFVVGDAPAPATTVGELLGDDDTGPVTGTAFGIVRAVQFGAIALALGAVHLHAVVLAAGPARHGRSGRRLAGGVERLLGPPAHAAAGLGGRRRCCRPRRRSCCRARSRAAPESVRRSAPT